MRFALLGSHPNALAVARALLATGRHELIALDPAASAFSTSGGSAQIIPDLEELLANPALDAVIVGSAADLCAVHLRRALQSEHHVLCVPPRPEDADLAYEATMIQGDTRRALVPLLAESLHPALARLAELTSPGPGRLGPPVLIEVERGVPTQQEGTWGGLPGWASLRRLGGEIAELAAFASTTEPAPEEPILVAGRFERGGLFQIRFAPEGLADQGDRMTVFARDGRARLDLPQGWSGPATLRWQIGESSQEETWPAWDPGPEMARVFVSAMEAASAGATAGDGGAVCWQDATRSLELDDAVRRSVERRRAVTLEYPEATEEVGFKGTMTLVGCGLVWAMLVLLILSRWMPFLGWLILPLVIFFLGLQLLRWILPRGSGEIASRPAQSTHHQA